MVVWPSTVPEEKKLVVLSLQRIFTIHAVSLGKMKVEMKQLAFAQFLEYYSTIYCTVEERRCNLLIMT